MATTTDYLTQLQEDKDTLVDNLTEQGITGLTGDETFTELVPKVLDIESGGGDLSEYFNTTASYFNNDRYGWTRYVKKLPDDITYTGTLLNRFFKEYEGATLDLSNFNVTNSVTSLNSMFQSCGNLDANSLKVIGNWDTSGVTDVANIFAQTSRYSTINDVTLDLSGWRCKSYASFLYNGNYLMEHLSSLNLSGVVTSATTTMRNMFNSISTPNLKKINMNNWDVSNVTDMALMFSSGNRDYTSLELDLSGWVTTSLRDTGSMFSYRCGLTKIDMRNFDFTNVTNSNNMFGSTAYEGVPNDCEIIVKDDTQKNWITSKFTRLTNVKTVAEYEAE